MPHNKETQYSILPAGLTPGGKLLPRAFLPAVA